MKTALTHLLLMGILLLNGGAGCFNKTTEPQPQAGYCKKIIVSEDGDETEYEFDGQGHLRQLFGQSVSSYYKDPYNFKLQWKFDDFNIQLDRGNVAWGYKIMDGAKNGFENTKYPTDRGKGQKIESLLSFGYEGNDTATEINEKYTYDANGNCVKVVGEGRVDFSSLLKYTTDIKYYPNKPTPFAGNPFQWLIEQAWSGGGHTNSHLTESEKKTYKAENDVHLSEGQVEVIYSYTYDKQGRVTRIQINTHEEANIKAKDTGEVHQTKDTKQKIITFVYDC